MNKAVTGIAVIVVLGAAYVGASAWTGQQAETRYRQQLATVQSKFPFLRTSAQSYQKGLFSSSSSITVQLGCDTADGRKLPAFTVTNTIHHGPLAGGALAGAVIDSQVHLPGGDAAALPSGVPLTARTVVGFGGSTTTTLSSAAASMPVPDGGELSWQGLTGTVESSSDARSVSFRLHSPGLTMSAPSRGLSIKLGAMDFQDDGKAVTETGTLKVGKGQGSLQSFELNVGAPAIGSAPGAPISVRFDGLQLATESQITDKLFGETAMLTGSGAIGAAKIDHLDMRFSMKRIHPASFERIIDTVTGFSARCDAGGKAADPMAQLDALQRNLQKDLMALLPYNPEYAMDKLSIDYAGQRGEMSYSISVQGVVPTDGQLQLPALLMSHGHVEASARLPVAWIQQLSQQAATRLQGKQPPDAAIVDAMIDQAAARGFVVRSGDYVNSSLAFANGALTVNGKVIPMGAAR